MENISSIGPTQPQFLPEELSQATDQLNEAVDKAAQAGETNRQSVISALVAEVEQEEQAAETAAAAAQETAINDQALVTEYQTTIGSPKQVVLISTHCNGR